MALEAEHQARLEERQARLEAEARAEAEARRAAEAEIARLKALCEQQARADGDPFRAQSQRGQ